MFDYITLCCIVGLVVSGTLWRVASSRAWYIDSDNDQVSFKSIFGWIWMVCLVTLIYQQVHYFLGRG